MSIIASDIISFMLLVKTYIAPSKIEGIGLFAGEDIKKGTLTWKYEPNFDYALSPGQVEKMPDLTKNFIKRYGTLSVESGLYIMCGDDARFTNHSNRPNLDAVKKDGEQEKVAIANRDIKKGEELAIDYRVIDKADATSNKEYLEG